LSAGNGRTTSAKVFRDLCQRPAVPMLQRKRSALGFGQSLQRRRQAQGQFEFLDALTWRRLIRRQPKLQSRGRIPQGLVQGLLAADVALGRRKFAQLVR
jgi:hypothetical protein